MSSNHHILGLASHKSLEWSRRETLDSSRHRTDYEILEDTGRGAFGTVYKVRNKVDGHVYAMKQVSDFSKHVLREVQVLSSIDHEHVVRYYGAWVEKGKN
jgi:translation initiation factor 2-alpha kinase 4